jgi:endonuclease G
MKSQWIYASFLVVSLTQCTWQPAATVSKDFQPAASPVIHRTGYVLDYDGRMRHAKWVYEELTAASLEGSTERAEFDFMEDPMIPPHLRASKSDYKGSGFDRGHLSPAANARSSAQVMKDTFYLSNISPQHPQLNRKYWVKLERHVREMTKSHAKVYVITGPLFLPEVDKDAKKYVRYQVIGENNIAVPTHYFKVIHGKTDEKILTEAYIIPNLPIENNPPLQNFAVSLEKVEKAAGLTFKK